ncbi:MAG: hypothetical protein ACK4IT_00640 [Thioalkalivibrionaceae bacterium]
MALLKKYWLVAILLVWVVAWYALSDDDVSSDKAAIEPSEEVAASLDEQSNTAAPHSQGDVQDQSSAEVEATSTEVEAKTETTARVAQPSSAPVNAERRGASAEPAESSVAAPLAVSEASSVEPVEPVPAESDAASSVAKTSASARAGGESGDRRDRRDAGSSRPSGFVVSDVIREARSLYWAEGVDAAIFVLERAIGRSDIDDRDRSRLLAELGDAYFAAGRIDHARTAYRSSVLQLPSRERAMMEQRYRHQGRW